ncbi:MAG: hypothetical protein WC947_08685 [Elusimicrobiota bacterium]
MKKLLSIIMVALMATSAFAYVPLSNSQLNIGSYQNSATRGMFYNELDIVSAAPVELLDFSGNALYTNWGNVRSFAGPYGAGTYNRALSWTGVTEPINVFTFGVTGNPLSYAGIEDSRSGVVYQNFGTKGVGFDLDSNAGTGTGGLDSEGTYKQDDYTVDYATVSVAPRRLQVTSSNMKYFTNDTNTQWNAGTSYKLMDKVSLGLSLARQTNTSILTTEGTKTYADNYLTRNGMVAGLPNPFGANINTVATATQGDTISVAYPTEEVDQNSTSQTDILPQVRVKISDDFFVDAGVGLRFSKTLNPGTVNGNVIANEKTVVTVTAREDVVLSTAPGGVGTQYFNTGTAIVEKSAANVALEYNQTNLFGNALLNSPVFTTANWAQTDNGVSAFSDEREGTAPLVRIEAVKKFEKVDITGIFNYSNLSQDIDASQTGREYVNTKAYVSTDTLGGGYAGGARVDNWTERDYTMTGIMTGKWTQSNLDIGAKISMKALEGVKLSFGGFIQKQTTKTDVDKTITTTDSTSYEDNSASTNSLVLGGLVQSSGTVSVANRPGPITNSDEDFSRTFAGMSGNNGFGEGTWSQITTATGNEIAETVTLTYRVPVGIEIPLSKKWTFRAGTEYIMTKTETTSEDTNVNDVGNQTTTATPGNAQTAVTNSAVADPVSETSVTRTEAHAVNYTYGVQFDATPSLTIACNAFLDTAGAGTLSNASFFDLATYRTLSLSAAIKF